MEITYEKIEEGEPEELKRLSDTKVRQLMKREQFDNDELLLLQQVLAYYINHVKVAGLNPNQLVPLLTLQVKIQDKIKL